MHQTSLYSFFYLAIVKRRWEQDWEHAMVSIKSIGMKLASAA